MTFPKLSRFKSPDEFRHRLQELGCASSLACDDSLLAAPDSPLAQPLRLGVRTLGNRWAILPMEGWDAAADGQPTDLVLRRWQRFGQSGAKLIWGGEAVAVRHDGRANPRQLVLTEHSLPALQTLRLSLVRSHQEAFGSSDDLLVGLQLTHSGRFARPNDSSRLEPLRAYPHPILDARYKIPADLPPISDSQLDQLIRDFITAGVRAQKAGFDFVDLKHCHGYLGHDLLSAVHRPGPFGGSFENRTRFLREIVEGLRREAPGLELGVRLSLFDQLPFQPGPDNTGIPAPWTGPYPYGFGANPQNPAQIDWAEPRRFLQLLSDLNIRLVCLTAGSPYYNPHIQRPASSPPSDGYQPPEDPLVGVARQAAAVAQAKSEFPNLLFVGSAYTYLQEWLPQVAQAQVRLGRTDLVGLGRMVLSYPELPADVLAGRALQRRKICRTFSECTSGPRKGLVSGCFPLDDFYKQHPDAARLKALLQQK